MALNDRKPIAHLLITLALVTGISTYEGYKPDAYIPVAGDVPTIGYGTTQFPDGTKVKLGDTVTRKQADEFLMHDLEKFKAGIGKCITAPLTKNEFKAYMSMAYNLGSGAVCNSSIPYKLNHGQYKEACTTILAFNKMRDTSKPKVRNPQTGVWQYQLKVIKGLDIRRKSEYATCISPDKP